MKFSIQPLLDRWYQLAERDRRALSWMAWVGVPVLFVSQLLLPAWQGYATAEQHYQQALSLRSQLLQLGPQLAQAPTATTSANELSGKVQGFADNYALTILRMETDGKTVRLNMNASSVQSTIRFLEACRLAGMQQDELVITPNESGVYAVRLRLSVR